MGRGPAGRKFRPPRPRPAQRGGAGGRAGERKPMLAVSGTEVVGARGVYRTKSFVSVPIVVNDVARGVLNVADPSEDRDFTQDDLATLEMLAGHIAACLQKQDQEEALRLLADTDPLTWLFNRRHLDRRPHRKSVAE